MNGTPSMIARRLGTALGIDFVDIPIPLEQRAPVRFTFFWTNRSSWEDHDYLVKVES